MKCVLINFIYIKSSILSLLIKNVSKEVYQIYGGAKYCLPPPPHEICINTFYIY